MQRFSLLLSILTLVCVTLGARAQGVLPFSFQATAPITLTKTQLVEAESKRTVGTADAAQKTLTFSQTDIKLVVRTGPEDDMLSYRIQGLRNPTLIVPEGAVVKVLFVNVDDDMPHDFRLGNVNPPFEARPDTAKTEGSEKLRAGTEAEFHAQRFTFSELQAGTLHYFCSVGAHAKNGMWGTVQVTKTSK